MPLDAEVSSTGEIAEGRQATASLRQNKRLPLRFGGILPVNDFEDLGRRHLPRSIFAFVSSGVEDEVTLRDNRAAFQDYRLVPRVLVGVSARSQETMLFGQTYNSP